jgi:hypothetical protein
MPSARDDVESEALGLIDRLVSLLEESLAFRRSLVAQAWNTADKEAARRFYFEVLGVVEAGLTRTADDLLAVLWREIGPRDNGR